MIYYFSGTGNSRIVAQRLGQLLHCDVTEIDTIHRTPVLNSCTSLGLVFPVYAWGVPSVVEHFLSCVTLRDVPYLWTVMTCGDDIGYADRILDVAVRRYAGRVMDAAYSVPMPNTYVCLPGFDVDTLVLAEKKVRQTKDALPRIASEISLYTRKREVVRGAFPWLKTYVLRPLFNRYLLTDRYFYANQADCIQCGLCQKQCPTGNIMLKNGIPEWEKTSCTGCLRCYHQCPKRAIEWGKMTKGKGQKQTVLPM